MSPTPAGSQRGRRLSQWWRPAWRMLLVITLGLAFLLVVLVSAIEVQEATNAPPESVFVQFLLDLVAGIIAIALFPLRHRWPLLVVSLIAALSAVSALAGPAAAFGLISLSTRRRRGEIAIGASAFLISTMVNLTITPTMDATPWWQGLIIGALITSVLVLIGLYIGGRRQLVTVLQDRAEQAERAQEAGVLRAAMVERTRIAREMHDTLAHRLSLVAMHAGVLEYRSDLSPEQIRQSAGVVRQNAQLAASDLREVLGVLRSPDVPASQEMARPAVSTLEAFQDLTTTTAQAGNPVDFKVSVGSAAALESLPASTRHHLSRIIQEGLTNVRKHAPGQPVRVELQGEPGRRIGVSIRNAVSKAPAPAAVSGFGLAGLRERAELAGGALHTDDAEGHFTLRAWFPWPQ